MPFTASEIARHLDGEVLGDGALVLKGFAHVATARPGDLTFAENDTYFTAAEQSQASAILVSADFKSNGKTLIKVKNSRVAFAKVMPLFFPEAPLPAGIHATAVVAASAQVDPSAHVGPHCVIGEGVRVGARSALLGGNHIGDGSRLGDDVKLFPNVVVYADTQIGHRVRIHAGTCIGSDGFGYVLDAGTHLKVPQIGNVIIHDDVEIGSNVSIDRGALGSTVIGKGTKIDNLVQVGHNVVIGEGCIIIAQVGIAGSSKLGNFVTLAGQAGIAGHLKIGDQAIIMAQSGVMTDVPPGVQWLGAPAQPDKDFKRQIIAIMKLPEALRRLRALEKRVGGGASGGANPARVQELK
ncbi:MAG: UDP-3-O-(3-hydroxymyristoyl)glucosamine N-acyltransferase [Verrucomicrobia bacterium]|nr:UDP-3-O-(3-hydroxymyristoyl)glucosamine N-acyltransferase [Verrucomicrobiota bacterium]